MNKLLGQHLNLENKWLWGLVKEETKTTIDFLKLNDELNPKIWDDQSKLKSQVRIKLLKIAKKFIQFLDMPQVTITDIQFTGSMANYNYSSYSDIDLHILIQYPEDCDNSLKELAQSKKMLWNKEHDIQIYNHQVELYPQDVNEPHTASGLYSVLKNEWIKVPVHREFQIDVDQILTKVRSWNAIIDEADTVEAVNDIKNRIKKMRKSGLEEGGEYSIENLTFKVLRNWGSIEKLNAIKLDKTDKELSLQEGILDEKTFSGTQAKQAFSESNKRGKQRGGSDARARKRAKKARDKKTERDANAKKRKAETDKIKMGYKESKGNNDPKKSGSATSGDDHWVNLKNMAEAIALSPNTDSSDVIFDAFKNFILNTLKLHKIKIENKISSLRTALNESWTDELLGGDVAKLASAIFKIFSPIEVIKQFFKDIWNIFKNRSEEKKEKTLSTIKNELEKLEELLQQFQNNKKELRVKLKSRYFENPNRRESFKKFWEDLEEKFEPYEDNLKKTIELAKQAVTAYEKDDKVELAKMAKKWRIQIGYENEQPEAKKPKAEEPEAEGPKAEEPETEGSETKKPEAEGSEAQSKDNQEEEKNN